MACAEGPKGFSLESSLMSCEERSSAACVSLGTLIVPRSRAGLERRSKMRLMPAAHHAMERFAAAIGLLHTVRSRSTSASVSARNFPGGNIEGERPVADALNLLHVVSNLFKHPPDLAIAAFD